MTANGDGREAAVMLDRLGERRRTQRDDELDRRARGSGRRGRAECRSSEEEEKAPSQSANRSREPSLQWRSTARMWRNW